MTEKIFQRPSWKLKSGIILVTLFSIITGLLNVGVLYLFGLPLFGILLGIIFIWIAKTELKTKFVWTILPLPLILSTFFFAYQLNKAEPETFLIPQNFRGKIVIFYEEKCGQEPVYEQGRRIYKFPDNGILITNFKKTRGILDQEFYFVDETGNRTPIPKRDVRDFNFNGRLSKTDNEPSKDEIAVFYSWAILPTVLSSKYQTFVISSYRFFEKDEKESWNEIKNFSEKSKNSLKECRRTKQ
jgi:energy-coupling factor transporter transmembrane protein EcfT